MKITKIESEKPALNVEEVKVREPLVQDLIKAERSTGKAQGVQFLTAVASQVCTFDGADLPPEEIERLSSKDFLALVEELGLVDVSTLPNG